MRLIRTAALGLALGLVAFADPIVIFNTGEGAGGNALAVGQTDPHYSLVSAPAGVSLAAITTAPNPAWIGNTATATWISPGNSGSINWAPGIYDYQTTFNLTGLDAATAQLSGMWTSDNNATIYLNGVSTGITTSQAPFGNLQAFSITSGFQAGLNTLDLMVDNQPLSAGGSQPNPTGVLMEVSGTAQPVPEPAGPAVLSGLLLCSLTVPRLRKLRRQ